MVADRAITKQLRLHPLFENPEVKAIRSVDENGSAKMRIEWLLTKGKYAGITDCDAFKHFQDSSSYEVCFLR